MQLIGEAALRPGMLKEELAELMYYMEEHRAKGKRRVSLILTDTQVTVNDMKSAVRQTASLRTRQPYVFHVHEV